MNSGKHQHTVVVAFLLLAPFAAAAADSPARAVECSPRRGLGNVFEKLNAGEHIRIAYLGGSITSQAGWRVKSRQWFQQQYPRAKVDEINAAIGGTGSDLGVFRLKHDVLDHRPDLLFVEFAVNDGGAPPERIHRSMEGIVRQTWKADPKIDICFVYTLAINMLGDLQAGGFPRAAAAMEELADHYGIPSIHMGLEAARLEEQGKVIFKAPKPKTAEQKEALAGKIIFSPDGVHPYTDTGHELYLQAIIRSMQKIKKIGRPGPHRPGEPFVADNWEDAKMVDLGRANLSAGWKKLDPSENSIARRFSPRMSEMYKADAPGETISFKFRGTGIEIYDILGPDCGQVIVRLDDQPQRIVPRFDAYCTYHRLAKLTVGHGLANTVHNVRIEIHPDQPDKAAILAKRSERMDKPARFDDAAWYIGAILLIGELVE